MTLFVVPSIHQPGSSKMTFREVLAYPMISALLRKNKNRPEEEFALGEE